MFSRLELKGLVWFPVVETTGLVLDPEMWNLVWFSVHIY